MAIDTSDFRNGMGIYLEGEPYVILEFQHVKPGKGGAFVRTRLRRLRTGNVIEKTFRAGERMDEAFIERKEMQFLYRAGSTLTVMDLETYEQIEIDESLLGESAKYLIDEMKVYAITVDGTPIGYEIPPFLEMEVIQTDPAFKGDTVSGGSTKPATLASGAVIQVPFHIKEGDIVKVDTRTDTYLERVRQK